MKKTSIYLIILFFANACNSQNSKKAELTLLYRSAYNIPNNDIYPSCISHITENDSDLIIFYNSDNKILLKYDYLTSKLLDSIKVGILPKHQVWSINYHNKDSIFVVYNAAQSENYNHSGTIVMINSLGELRKSFSLAGLPVKCNECGSINTNNLEYIANIYGELPYFKSKLYIQLQSWNFKLGDTLYGNNKHPVSASLDLTKNSAEIHPIYIANKTGCFYPKRSKVISNCVNKYGNLIVGFNTSSRIQEFNPISNTTTSHQIKSVFGDTIYPQNQIIKTQDDYSQISFQELYYNKYQNSYLRISRLALPLKVSLKEKRDPDYGITMLDSNFNILGECVLPKGLSPTCYFSKVGVSFWNKEESKKNNSICFNTYSINFQKSNHLDILKDIRKRDTIQYELGIYAYIKNNFKTPAGKFITVFLPIKQSCKPCIDHITQYVVEKQKNMSLYFILASDSKSDILDYIKQYNIQINNKLWIDDNLKYIKYFENTIFNGFVTFIENNNVIMEIPIIPGNLEKIKLEISKFL